jgi:hypothetical protein
MKTINKKQFSHKDLNAARKRGVIYGLVWAIDLVYMEQRKAAKKGLQTNAIDIEKAIQKALNDTRGPIKL